MKDNKNLVNFIKSVIIAGFLIFIGFVAKKVMEWLKVNKEKMKVSYT